MRKISGGIPSSASIEATCGVILSNFLLSVLKALDLFPDKRVWDCTVRMAS